MAELREGLHPQTQECSGTKSETDADENFEAMRHAALSMFKQRTKDLTMVSALTAEADQVEQLNTQVQSTIQKLQEQKASLEAQIEAEERRVKQWEAQLREVHGMLAQMKEDQTMFAGTQRSSEKIVLTLQHFVSQYTEKGGDVSRLLDRAQEATGGRTPNEWRGATNDLRRRGVVLREHIEQIEKQQIVPQALMDLIIEWTKGGWKTSPDYSPALRVCEQLVFYDPEQDVRELVASRLRWDAAKSRTINASTEGAETLVDDAIRELDELLEAVAAVERECEDAGLCCTSTLKDSLNGVKEQWLNVPQSRQLLIDGVRLTEVWKKQLEEQVLVSNLVSERVGTLSSHIDEAESNFRHEKKNSESSREMCNNLQLSWTKALNLVLMHERNIAIREVAIWTVEAESQKLQTKLESILALTDARWGAIQAQVIQLCAAVAAGKQEAAAAQLLLEGTAKDCKSVSENLSELQDTCTKFEAELRHECEMIPGRLPICFTTEPPQSEEETSQTEEEEENLIPETTTRQDVLDELLEFPVGSDVGFTASALGTGLTSTGLEVELLRCVAQCVIAMKKQGLDVEEKYRAWKCRMDEELAAANAD
ncbi:hypothetical protein, conserved [Trypanosoma brucei gambiense DAL972]|uniref:Uncharacterized protein n=1 Tax=Trypanosoma brucei gambiense (strain MHOM/CI/86/DAL972) TaxID=679716 RepID=D0A719_TRYB9|nr:hypothetical protein, conserved [Trypanosoma brucei gambiense DAL972]CBH17470.1 hypothetical protein, conserved [Trypanosoma brucei gambiense DAL972]|eukprot:XP_011779734.1 hypothetical protein, conserved [Trypanosoma brucei gambiense DAL972]